MIANVRRIDKERLEKLGIILRDFRSGKSVQEISEKRGYKKQMVYQTMYYLKKMNLLPVDFKNPRGTVYTDDLTGLIDKEANNAKD